MRHAESRGRGHLRVILEHRSHFERGDVEAAADDDVVFAVAQVEEPVRIQMPDVAGAHPAVGEEHPGGGGRIADIATGGDTLRLEMDLAGDPGGRLGSG